MKKIFFISAFVLLTSYACQKEVITKNTDLTERETEQTPSAREIHNSLDLANLPGSEDKTNPGGDITDPNNDPDLNKKKTKN